MVRLSSILCCLFKEYVQFFKRLYDITWFVIRYYLVWGGLRLITCSKNKHIPYNFIFTTKCNDSSILITIISWDYLNWSLVNEYVGNLMIPIQVIKYVQCCSRQISQSGCSIDIKLNYWYMFTRTFIKKIFHIYKISALNRKHNIKQQQYMYFICNVF